LITPKKSLGQNFLVDARVARRIIDSVSPTAKDVIVEIGPGKGALTQMLVERSGVVVTIEIDRRLAQSLRESIGAANLTIVEGDALEIDWRQLTDSATAKLRSTAPDAGSPKIRVVANLPYYISTAILEKLLLAREVVSDMTLMLQSEVVERMASDPGCKEYGYLSIVVQYYCTVSKLFDVAPSAFSPAPKVWSSVIRLMLRERPAVSVDDDDKFLALVRASFAHRRKTLANNLKAAGERLLEAGSIAGSLEEAQIDPRRRAETLSLDEFARLYRALISR
jgi:16S rRNA (adenine1518-N6/adenine1519-N6)-dimethyltransferase